MSRVHFPEKTEGKRYPCPVCQKPFWSSHALECHSLACTGIHYKSTVFPCRLCPRTFSNSVHLSRHLRMGHRQRCIKEKDHESKTIEESKQVDAMEEEGSIVMSRERNDDDEDVAVKQEAILPDADVDARVQQMILDAVNEENAAKYALDDWNSIEEVQPFNPVEPFNPFEATKVSKPKRKPEGQVTCPICERTFTNENYLKTHIKAKYPIIVFPTDDDEAVTNKRAKDGPSDDHETFPVASNVLKKRFSCPVCNKTFKVPSRLKEHSVVHTKEKPFPCTLCPQVFSHRRGLNNHVTRIHFPETAKRFPCPVCKKTFVSPTDVKRHSVSCAKSTEWIRMNADDEAKVETILPDVSLPDSRNHCSSFCFQCRQCPQTFTSYANLSRHVTQVHVPKHGFGEGVI